MTVTLTSAEQEKLLKVPLFRGLSPEEIATVLAAARIRKIAAEEYFFFQGDPAEALFILKQGRIKLTQVNPDGQQILLRVLGAWNLFAAVALVENNTYPVSAQAGEDCQALYWAKDDLSRLVESIPRMALNAMRLLTGYVKEFQDRYRELATERVERRLARAILHLANQTGRKTPEGVLIDLPLTRQDLAEMTGTTLYTVSRILSQWESNGLILSGREKVVVRYPHGLVKIADDLP
jgi:CRP/FNR family transcriptional regulator, nitrogen oxide reductase regulator